MHTNNTPERFQHKKSLGQHFLNNVHVPRQMADAGSVTAGDVVLEVGPGTGALTRELLSRGARVLAIEVDARAIEALSRDFADAIASKNLMLISTDVRTLNLGTLGLIPHGYKVISNIPYYLSGLLFRLFLDTHCQPSTLVFLVQREVALRIARDQKESLLSLSVKAYGDVRYVKTVGKGNFTPPPKVDSAIVSVTDISHVRIGEENERAFFSLIHAGFGSKRKQLIGNLSKHYPRDALAHIFSSLQIPLDVRAEDIHLPLWRELTLHIIHHTEHTPFPHG